VVGHTDDQPINTGRFPSNWELSLVRGSRVARYLIEAAGLDPTRFIIMGRGQYAPAVPNEDASNRALNRRVEIIITRDIEPSRQEVPS
jgi:chemotaxis protein MotB